MRSAKWEWVRGGVLGCCLLVFSCGPAEDPIFHNGDDDSEGDDDATDSVATSGVIFTEVMANPGRVTDSDGEWLELYNIGSDDVDLSGWTVTDADGVSFTIEDITIAGQDYVVLGNNVNTEENGGVSLDFAYTDLVIGNDEESLTLANGSGSVVDIISWTKAPEGASLSLDPKRYDPLQHDDSQNLCASKYSKISSGDLGTPRALNDVCFVIASAGDLVITEIMANPSAVGDSRGEYLEIFNDTMDTIDLNGFVIEDPAGDQHTIADEDGVTVGPKSLIVLGNHFNEDENGGITIDYSWESDIILDDTGGTLKILAGQTEVDVVEYGGVGFPATPEGASLQLDPDKHDATSNDDGTNWCTSTDSLSGGDKGTPGSSNDAC